MSASLWLSAERRHRSAPSAERQRCASADLPRFCDGFGSGQSSCGGMASRRGPRRHPISGHRGASSPRCGIGTLCKQHLHGLPGSHLRMYQLCICRATRSGVGLTLRRRTLHLQQAPPAASRALISRRPFSVRGPRRPPFATMDVLMVETCLLMESLIRSPRLGRRASGWSFGAGAGATSVWIVWADCGLDDSWWMNLSDCSNAWYSGTDGRPGRQSAESSSVEERENDDERRPGGGWGFKVTWAGSRRDMETSRLLTSWL
jgi:hypothetical protein